jgi:DNA-binding SARP family transcriptional activator/ABC-type glycerol-3-phosphate transport system substrate-binding protein
MRVTVLGPVAVDSDRSSITAPKQRALLGFLAAHRGVASSADRIAEALWGDDLPEDPAGAVAFHISRLRAALGQDAIETTPHGYLLADVELDADEFESLANEGKELLEHDPAQAVDLLEEALGRWHGAPFEGSAEDTTVHSEALRLEELRIQAEEARALALLNLGRGSSAIADLERLVADHPLRERPVSLLMRALGAAGRHADALTAYENCRARMIRELGVEPGASLQGVYEEALKSSDRRHSPVETRNPYKGLRPFLEGDSDDFFGREEIVEAVFGRIEGGDRFIAIVGPSGSGKSSLLRAGVVSGLRSGGLTGSQEWPIAVMHPGSHPFEELEAALFRATTRPMAQLLEVLEKDRRGLARAVKQLTPESKRLVLVIDQLEELYRLTSAEACARFEDLLAATISDEELPLVILVGLRADNYDRPLAHPGLAESFGASTMTVPPLGHAELERAISGPARRVGVTVEPELEARVMTDVIDRPGELPLLQYALTETFDQRSDGQVGIREYESVGGVEGALVTTADRLYHDLDREAQKTLRRMMLSLVAVDARGASRRRVHLRDLRDIHLDWILPALDEQRLITYDRDPATGDPTVEVAHECLFEVWPRFAGWIEDRRDDLRLRNRLIDTAQEWAEAGEDPEFLLTRGRLAQIRGWAGETDLPMGATEKRFLEASVALDARRAAEEAERANREREMERRSRTRGRVIAVIGGIASIVFALAGVAWWQGQQARDLAAEVDRLREAESLIAAANQNLAVDPELSILLSYEAMKVTASVDGTVLPGAVDAMHWGLQDSHVTFPFADAPAVVRGHPGEGLRGVFDIALADLVELAADSVSRSLTQAECEAYLGRDDCTRPDPRVFEGDLVELERTELREPRDLSGTKLIVYVSEENAAPFIAFAQETGIAIQPWLSAPGAITGAAGETLPDVMLFPQPGWVQELADIGLLIDLAAFIDVDAIENRYGPELKSLVTVGSDGTWPSSDGALHGLWKDVEYKSLIWYSKSAFEEAGYEVPGTWAGLRQLVSQIKAEGGVPWCAGLSDSGFAPASGWPATDWVEDILLHRVGPDPYDDWAFHRIPFDSRVVRDAFEEYGRVVHEDNEFASPDLDPLELGILDTRPLLADPPGCWLMRQASFLVDPAFLIDAEPDDLGYFRFPAPDPVFQDAVVVGGQVVMALSDRPEVRELFKFMLSDAWGEILMNNGRWISADRTFPVDLYPAQLQRDTARWLAAAQEQGLVRFDASDLMPPRLGGAGIDAETSESWRGAFFQGMLDYTADPSTLDQVLAEIEQTWQGLED